MNKDYLMRKNKYVKIVKKIKKKDQIINFN